MGKEKFIYNTQTLRYEKVTVPLKVKLFRIVGFLSMVLVTAFVLMIVSAKFFPSAQERALQRELEQMKYKYVALNNQFDLMDKVLHNIQERDAGVHRMLFGMDPIDDNVWNGGVGGHKRNQDVTNFRGTGQLLINTQNRVDKLARQLTVQSQSLDTIEYLTRDRETMLASIPMIKPIREDKLKRNIRALSGFGRRFHPIFKRTRMHWGIDFTSPEGTPIQATGDGVIEKVAKLKSGYGKHVIINHGYGYKTLYAHMSKIDVKKGQKIKRGQTIGLVGNTGYSTAPHLHYEVIHKGQKVNPIHYCMDGLTPEEYQDLVNLAAISNQSFD